MKQWNQISTNIINTAINQDPPYDMMEDYQLYMALVEYLVNRAQEDPNLLTAEEGVYHNKLSNKIYFKLTGFRSFLIRKGQFNKDLTAWRLGNKMNEIYIPTDEIDFNSESRVKRKLDIGQETMRIRGKSLYLRYISDEEIQIQQNKEADYEGVI
jgi:hypothetical protein